MYLRFVISRREEEDGRPRGLFQAAWELERAGALDAEERAWLSDAVLWFEEHLPGRCRATFVVPGAPGDGKRVVFWIKNSAREHLRRMRRLTTMLRAYGVETRTLRTHCPGRIVFEDEYLVGAIPYVPTRTALTAPRRRPAVTSRS
jgi:hypothetical protein